MGGGKLLIKLKIKNNRKTVEINSEYIRKILSERDDFDAIQDISKSLTEKNMMAFDCKLNDAIFSVDSISELLEELSEEEDITAITELLEADGMSVGFEDVRTYLKDLTDEVESDLRDKYETEYIRCFFNVYNIDETFTEFKLVFVISFKEIGIAYLTSFASMLGRKQLDGSSKFYS